MLVSRILAEFSTAKSLWRVLRALVLLFLADRSCSTYLNPSHKVSTESKRLSAKPPTACTKTVRDNTTRSCTRLIKGTAHGTCTEPAHGTFFVRRLPFQLQRLPELLSQEAYAFPAQHKTLPFAKLPVNPQKSRF